MRVAPLEPTQASSFPARDTSLYSRIESSANGCGCEELATQVPRVDGYPVDWFVCPRALALLAALCSATRRRRTAGYRSKVTDPRCDRRPQPCLELNCNRVKDICLQTRNDCCNAEYSSPSLITFFVWQFEFLFISASVYFVLQGCKREVLYR